MTFMYAARMARPDLLRPTTRLASYVTKWSPYRGKPLYRLVCYIWSTLGGMQECHNAQSDANTLQVVAYSDADFACCLATQRSTVGGHLCIEGRPSHSHLHSLSKRQDSTASSTLEAEFVDAVTVIRHMLVSSLDLWGMLRQKRYKNLRGVLREDNDACMKVIQSGRNPTMRHLHRVHGVSVRVFHANAGMGKESSFVGVIYTPR